MPKELLTLQFGGYSNYVGAHFWNAQDELLSEAYGSAGGAGPGAAGAPKPGAQPANPRLMKQHDGAMSVSILPDILGTKTLRHIGIYLNSAALPLPSNGVFQGVFNLGPIKRTFAWQIFKVAS